MILWNDKMFAKAGLIRFMEAGNKIIMQKALKV
jgi:preprotein translocase subunit Sec61beta